MAVIEIIKKPDPRLYQVSKPITKITPEIQTLASDMLETLKEKKGLGLAAPQVGHNVRLIAAVEPDRKRMMLIVNPAITYKKGKTQWHEQCLSVPGKTVKVERYKRIKVKGFFDFGQVAKWKTIKATGDFAAILQHEIDHLDGKLIG